MREEKWRGVEWRRWDDGMDLAGVQWRGNLAGYAKSILSRSRPAHSLIFGTSVHKICGNVPSKLNRSQNTVFNIQVLAHSCLSSSGKKSTWGTPIPARDLPLKRRGFGVKKSGVIGANDCLARDRLASNSFAVIRVPGIERPAARKELMTLEDTDS
jgi:hypothetical protein